MKNNYFLNSLKIPSKLLMYLESKGYLRWMNDEIHLQFMYWVRIGKRLNLNKPKSFNEKLQWLKLYDRNPIYTQLVDKYEVRRYITNVIGEKYLIPLLGVYNDFDEIDIEKLPEAFVLKCTHDSGGLLICKDKKSLDLEEAKVKFNRWLKRNFYFNSREWPYKNVEPRIICEEFKLDESSTELKDYKFMCFNGEAKCLFVCLNRNSPNGLNVDFYDMDWNPMPFERHYLNSKSIINKPKNFKKMVEFAEKLSKNIPFVRVDFYEINGNLFFGELTFYPGSGYEKFKPESFDYLLGSWIELPTKQF